MHCTVPPLTSCLLYLHRYDCSVLITVLLYFNITTGDTFLADSRFGEVLAILFRPTVSIDDTFQRYC